LNNFEAIGFWVFNVRKCFRHRYGKWEASDKTSTTSYCILHVKFDHYGFIPKAMNKTSIRMVFDPTHSQTKKSGGASAGLPFEELPPYYVMGSFPRGTNHKID
jgi:hypothetical protein